MSNCSLDFDLTVLMSVAQCMFIAVCNDRVDDERHLPQATKTNSHLIHHHDLNGLIVKEN